MVVPWTIHLMQERDSLRQWMVQAKAGDVEAFERILILHERLVLRTAQRLLTNNEDAKDAAQEVFVRFHRALSRFKAEKELVPWLYRITVNTCHDLRRRRKRSVALEEAEEMADLRKTPEELLQADQLRGMLRRALETLPERERDAVVLRDLEGLRTAEVAQILGSSEGTVRSQIFSARAKIRKFVDQNSGGAYER